MNEQMHNLSVKSPLDIDFYKFTMGFFVWKYFPNEMVTYKFKNRTKNISLSHLEKTVNYELQSIKSAYCYTDDELSYISSLGVFPIEFVNFLKTVKLPDIKVFSADGDLQIETTGPWKHSIWWETMVLSAVNYICYKDLAFLSNKDYKAIGEERLYEKIKLLKQHLKVRFSEFGTRRRLSFEWQKHVLEILIKEVPEMVLGTSNVLLAKELGIKPVGTMAHEIFMIGSRLFGDSDDDIRSSHGKILDMWYDLLGKDFSIALTDTFGSAFFLDDFGKERGEKWIGMRQDSGIPEVFAQNQLNFYKNNGISSIGKKFVPSDGLNANKIIELTDMFSDKIDVGAGWGTNLSNDCGMKAVSIVMKAVSVNGLGTVKLSDNIAKAIGSPEDIERFKRIFGYTNLGSQELVY